MFRRKEPIQPEWLIVGLGNPGPEYRHTRHNVGFEIIDVLAARARIKVASGQHRAMVGTGRIEGVAVALAKPLTYMNRSGQSIAPLARMYGLKPERVFIIADDLDIAVGKLRLRESGSSGGHNGHESIIASLKTRDYPRLKVGVGRPGSDTIDYVLGKFDVMERPVIDAAIEQSARVVEKLLSQGMQPAQELAAQANKLLNE